MQTADGVPVVHGLRVWVTLTEAGTVNLVTGRGGSAGVGPVVYLDGGRAAHADPGSLNALHPHTGQEPPPLGACQWVLECGREAERMHPHSLMSPVPVCGDCITTFGLRLA